MRTRSARPFARRAGAPADVAGVLTLAGAFLVPEPYVSAWLYAGSAATVAAMVWGTRRLGRFRCPDCDAPLPYVPPAVGERLRYTCAPCETAWETGLTNTPD